MDNLDLKIFILNLINNVATFVIIQKKKMNKMNVYFKTVKINLGDEESKENINKFTCSSIGSFSSTNSDFNYKIKKTNEENLITDSSELMSHIDNFKCIYI